MKCYIVKDLLPLYAEQLTNEKTAAEIQAHLEQCADCAKTFAQMQERPAPQIAVPENIRPLKAVKNRSRMIILAAAVAAAVLMLLFYKFCIVGVMLRSDQIKMEISTSWTYFVEEDNNKMSMHSAATREQAEANVKDKNCVQMMECVKIEYSGDCMEWRQDSWSAQYPSNSQHPQEVDDFSTNGPKVIGHTFYGVCLPRSVNSQKWAKYGKTYNVTEGGVLVIECKNNTYWYGLAELAALADAAPDGKAVLTVGDISASVAHE